MDKESRINLELEVSNIGSSAPSIGSGWCERLVFETHYMSFKHQVIALVYHGQLDLEVQALVLQDVLYTKSSY